MREGDLEGTLLSVLSSSGGKDLLQEAAEFSIDAVLGDGILKDIPFVGVVAKLYGVSVGVQGYIFTKKLKRFITELASIPQGERDQFSEQLATDSELGARTSEVLLSLLARIDDLQKAPLLARAFSGYVRNEYDFTTFQRLGVALDRCLVADLRQLENLKFPKGLDDYIGDMLVSSGLATINAIPQIAGPGSQTTYKISLLGELFLQVVVNGLPRDE